jgi:putative ABC transport system permease protein
LLASALTAIGVYAVLAAYVKQRQREFGIRIALGALPRDVRSRVLLESLRLALMGGGIGLLLSVALGKILASSLMTLNPFDLRLYAGTSLGMAAIVILSTLVPARRAARLDPLVTLRSE